MNKIADPKKGLKYLLYATIFLALTYALYIIQKDNYLLFHAIIELTSISIIIGTFILAWNVRNKSDNKTIIYLSFAYLIIAVFDTLHTLSYKGMGVFPGNNDYATRLWIAARYLESLSILLLLYIPLSKRVKPGYVLLFFTLIGTALLSTILYFDIFPICLVPGVGLTRFKVISEYIICFILLLSLIPLFVKVDKQDKESRVYLILSIIITIFSELSFTLYKDAYGLMNMLGHYLKLFSFYFIYKSFIESTLNRPIDILFKELKANEEALFHTNQTKNQLFSIFAHDLKNPFNGLIGFLTILETNYDDLDNEQKKSYINYCKNSADNCLLLFNNLLSWTRLHFDDNIYNTPKKVNILNLVKNSYELYSSMLKEKQIVTTINIAPELQISIDQDIFSLIIRNLFYNAIKFTPTKGSIELEVKLNDKYQCEVKVKDSGIGMEREQITRLFEKKRVETKSGTHGEIGTGLGLLLVIDFIKKAKGKINVNSIPGKGTEFIVTLPVEGID